MGESKGGKISLTEFVQLSDQEILRRAEEARACEPVYELSPSDGKSGSDLPCGEEEAESLRGSSRGWTTDEEGSGSEGDLPTSNAQGPRKPNFDVSVQEARNHAVAAALSGETYRAHPDPRAALLDHVVAGKRGFMLENGGRRLTIDQKAALLKQLEAEDGRAGEPRYGLRG